MSFGLNSASEVAVAVEFLSGLRVSPLRQKKTEEEMTGELCDPGLRRPLLSSLSSSLAWEQEARVADLPVGRGSVMTLPRNAGLPCTRPAEGSCWGRGRPLLPCSICNHYLFIFGS